MGNIVLPIQQNINGISHLCQKKDNVNRNEQKVKQINMLPSSSLNVRFHNASSGVCNCCKI